MEETIVSEHVESAVVDEWCGHVRTATRATPYNRLIIRLTIRQREVSVSVWSHNKYWPLRTASTDNYKQPLGKDGCRRCDLRTAAKPPQLLACPRVVTPDVVRSVRYQFWASRCRRYRRGAP